MYDKFKLSTFVHKGVSTEERRSPGFKSALLLLPELYAAHLCPTKTSWAETDNKRPTKDHLMFFPSENFTEVRSRFKSSTRAEIHIQPGLLCEITFLIGRRLIGGITFSIRADGHLGAGFFS